MPLPLGRREGQPRADPPPARGGRWAQGVILAGFALLLWSGITVLGEQSVGQAAGPSASVTAERDHANADRRRARQRARPDKDKDKLIEPPLPRPGRGKSKAIVQKPIAKVRPDSIEIPVLGIEQDLVELAVIGTDLQVPDDYSDIGWWRGGPVPGKKGAAVVVGHVDSPTGPAVFYRLSGLVKGDDIEVVLDDGARAVFEVRTAEVYDQSEFPSRRVYRTSGRPALHLLTCGGQFDAAAGRYESNVVVYAELVKTVPAPSKKKDKHAGGDKDKKQDRKKQDRKKQDQQRQDQGNQDREGKRGGGGR